MYISRTRKVKEKLKERKTLFSTLLQIGIENRNNNFHF